MGSRGRNLYRSLLLAHKKYLPTEMRELGDAYVKSEFRLHKSAKPEHLPMFFAEWEKYLEQLAMTGRAQESIHMGSLDKELSKGAEKQSVFQFGVDLPSDLELTDEQLQQLKKLWDEAGKIGRPKDV